ALALGVTGRAGGKYDPCNLGDLAASAFRPSEGDQARQRALHGGRVGGGAGLMMLGGLHRSGPGDVGGPEGKPGPLADVLPVKMTELDRQDFGAKLRADKHLPPPVQIRPAPQTAGNFLTLLTTPDKNAAL